MTPIPNAAVWAFASETISIVVGLALFFLVLWQAPRHRENQLMAFFMLVLVFWGACNSLARLMFLMGLDNSIPFYLSALAVGLNGFSLFLLVSHYADLWEETRIQIFIWIEAVVLFMAGVFIFQGRAVVFVPEPINDLLNYQILPAGYVIFILIYTCYLAAAAILWIYRHQRVRSLMYGVILTSAGVLSTIIPALQDTPLDIALAAAASILFARAILIEKLFNPLEELNERLANANRRLANTNTRLAAANQNLEEARDRAEAASQAKSTFLANMSHELRTPLNAIIGYSEMLVELAQEKEQAEFIPDLGKIQAAGTHLLSLINDILDLSKIEAGKAEVYLETFEVGALVQEIVNLIQPLVDQNANRLEVILGSDLGTIQADQTKVRQILYNLLNNACKFTDHGLIRLRAGKTNRPALAGSGLPPQAWISFEVSDTGIGIRPDQIDRLFQPFTQADPSTTRKYGGTGLGLTISQHFAAMMGGEIRVNSLPGEGSVFTLLLPACSPTRMSGEVTDAKTSAG